VLLLAAATSWVGRPACGTGRGTAPPRRCPDVLHRLLLRPVLLVGARFALVPGGPRVRAAACRSARRSPAWSSGVTGVVATATFAVSLAAVQDDPTAYGWHADFSVVDAKEESVAQLVADPEVSDVDLVAETTVLVDGVSTPAYAAESPQGVRCPGPS
jgi:hypothetical protein